MAILDLIKPKWKHSDPEVRLKAVREMEPEATERLRTIAVTDLDTRVRVEAIRKISDENLLTDVAGGAGDSPVIEAARARLNALYRDNIFQVTDASARKLILEKLDDEEMLTRIACDIDDPEVRMAAAEKIADPERLCRIAESNCGLKTGLAIVDRLDDPEHLERVSRNATNKKVRKQAEEKRTGTAEAAPDADAEREAELIRICRTLEDPEHSLNPEAAEAILERSETDWRAIDPKEAHPLCERFDAVRGRIRERLNRMAREKKIRETLLALCEAAEALTGNPPEDAPSRMFALAADWENARLSELPEAVAGAFRARFDQARKTLDKHLESMEQRAAVRREGSALLEELCRKAEMLAADACETDSEADWIELQSRWKALFFQDPRTEAIRERFEAARKAASERREAHAAAEKAARAEAEDRLRALCAEVEAAVDAEDRSGLAKKVKSSLEEWRTIGDRASELKAELNPRFEQACDRFFEKQREQREQRGWELWANLNRKEDLCKAVELLVRDGISEGAADVVQDARKRWRDIGPVSRDVSEEIWNRFNRACDEIHERCLTEKKELMDQLRALIDPVENTPSGNVNRNEIAESVKALQARWNRIGLLPAAVEKDLRREFQETCNAFFGRLRTFYQERDQTRRENLKLKSEWTEAAENLARSDNWIETAQNLKELQRRWKTVGPVPKDSGDELWERFQTACNTFFERMTAAEPDHIRQKEALCEKAEALVAEATDDSDILRVSRELMDLQRRWKAVGPVPAEIAEELRARFRKPCDAFFARRNAFFNRRKSEQLENQARKETLTARAEALSNSTDWREAGEELKALQQSWKEIGPAPRKREEILWSRFRSACDTFFSRRNAHFGQIDQSRLENLQRKEQLCIALEALIRLLMPETDSPGRVVAPAEQLSMALAFKDEILVPGNRKETWARALRKVRRIQSEWKTIGPVPSEKDRDLRNRFRRAADLFFRSRSDSAGREDAASKNGNDPIAVEDNA